MNKAPRVCLFSRLVRSLLVYSIQDDIYSIYRRYVGCQYPGAAVERPPSASAHHASPCCEAELEATLQRQEALPLSMRLGKCSGCVGKPKRMQRKALHVRIPARWVEKENKNKKCGWATIPPLLPAEPHHRGRRRQPGPHLPPVEQEPILQHTDSKLPRVPITHPIQFRIK